MVVLKPKSNIGIYFRKYVTDIMMSIYYLCNRF